VLKYYVMNEVSKQLVLLVLYTFPTNTS